MKVFEVGFGYDDFCDGGWSCVYRTLDYNKAKAALKTCKKKNSKLDWEILSFNLDTFEYF